MSEVAAVDIGGTTIAVGIADADGVLLRCTSVPTPASQGPAAVLEAVSAAVRELADPGSLAAVGVGTAGVIDPRSGVVRSATRSIPGWSGTDVRGELARELDLPVSVVNDVQAHALGEDWRGAARGKDSALFVAVGTGVGAGLLLQGRLHHGVGSAAGHAGHVPAPGAVGRPCPCGAHGHVEAVASGPAISAEYRNRAGKDAVDLPVVATAAGAGDPVAVEVLGEAATALGSTLGGLVNFLAPEVVVVGGGVAATGAAWWGPLRRAFTSELLPALTDTSLAPSALGSDAALVGAARLAWRKVS